MAPDVELFIGIAGIAGVFVGFGALISFTTGDDVEERRLVQIRGVVSIGLLAIIAAVVPILLDRYDLAERTVWLVSSLTFLALVWVGVILGLRRPEQRAVLRSNSRFQSIFFWVVLELPIHIPLVLAVFGVSPGLDHAFYTTALVFHLFEGAFVLTQLVYAKATRA